MGKKSNRSARGGAAADYLIGVVACSIVILSFVPIVVFALKSVDATIYDVYNEGLFGSERESFSKLRGSLAAKNALISELNYEILNLKSRFDRNDRGYNVLSDLFEARTKVAKLEESLRASDATAATHAPVDFSQALKDLKASLTKCRTELAERAADGGVGASAELAKSKEALQLVVDKWQNALKEIEELKSGTLRRPPPPPPPDDGAAAAVMPNDCFDKTFEFDVDRPAGNVFYDFDSSSARVCRDACDESEQCLTWVFVRSQSKCYLKDELIMEIRQSPCCVSGIKCR